MYACGTAETERDGEIEKGVSVGGQLDTGLGSMHTALLPPPALGSPLPLPALSFHRSFNPFIRPADHALRSASLSLCFSPSLVVVRGEGEKEEEEERLFPLSFSPCPCLCTRRLLSLLLLLLLDQLRQRIEWNEEGGAVVRCFLHGGKGRKGDGLRMVRVER